MSKQIIRCLALSPSSYSEKSLKRKGFLKFSTQTADPDFLWLYKETSANFDQNLMLKNVQLSGLIPVSEFRPYDPQKTKNMWSCIIKHSKFCKKNIENIGLNIQPCYAEEFYTISHTSKYELELLIAIHGLIMASDIDNF